MFQCSKTLFIVAETSYCPILKTLALMNPSRQDALVSIICPKSITLTVIEPFEDEMGTHKSENYKFLVGSYMLT